MNIQSIIFLSLTCLFSLNACNSKQNEKPSLSGKKKILIEEHKKLEEHKNIEEDENITQSKTLELIPMKKVEGEYMSSQANNNYHPRNLNDNNLNTAWALGLNKYEAEFGIVQGPIFTLSSPSRIAGVEIYNGYGKNENSFKNNTRAAKVLVYRYHPEYDGEMAEGQSEGAIDEKDIIYKGPLDDSSARQFFEVSRNYDNSEPTLMVALIFEDPNSPTGYYHGNKWNDLCISEVHFYK